LPSEYHVDRALNDLPTQGRILGVVRVDTGAEFQMAPKEAKRVGDYLKIQVTRDRLQINQAYEQLSKAVRLSLDFYAVNSMRRRLRQAEYERPSSSTAESAGTVRDVLESSRNAIPEDVFERIDVAVSNFQSTARKEQNYRDALATLLGPLATAGMAALALEHETARELTLLERLARKMTSSQALDIPVAGEELLTWIRRFRETRRMFEPLTNTEDRETVRPFRVARVVSLVRTSLGVVQK